MALEEADLKKIEEIVQKTLKDNMTEHPVKCPLPVEWAESIGHFSGMVQDIGQGDMRTGVENIRSYFKAMDSFLKMRKNIADWITKTTVVTFIAMILGAIGYGIRAWFFDGR